MANVTTPQIIETIGKEGYTLHVVGGAAAIPEGVMVAQLAADGTLVNGSTALSGPVIGVSTHSAAIGAVCAVETERDYLFDNDANSPCSAATLIGAAVYCKDNHTVAAASGGTLFYAGTFRGMDPSGKVRVHISPLQPAPAADATEIDELQANAVAKKELELDVVAFTKVDGTSLAKYSAANDGTCGTYGDGTKVLGVRWNNTAGTTDTIAKTFKVPRDLDTTAAPKVYIKCAKVGATAGDATTFVVGLYAQTEGEAYDAGANLGGTTGAITGDATSKDVQLVSVTCSAMPDNASGMTITINPTAAKLGTDDIIITHAWVEYTPKMLAA
jgi:hypothetical protein